MIKFEQINFKDKISELTPFTYRVGDFLNWVYSIILEPIQDVSDRWWKFFSFYDNILIHNAQTIYLEKYLNDLFDDDNRGIYIENQYSEAAYFFNDDEAFNEPYLYSESEGEDGLYIFNDGEGASDSNFIVYVPTSAGLITDTDFLNQITAEVNRYVFAGLKFQIINY